jgi:hypothetical protein
MGSGEIARYLGSYRSEPVRRAAISAVEVLQELAGKAGAAEAQALALISGRIVPRPELAECGRAQQPPEADEEAGGKTLRHRRGKFACRTSLPADAGPEKIDAQLTGGILTVRLPKATQARSRRIEVKG